MLTADIDVVIFVERGIRDGLSQYFDRYARANNKYMQSYDPLLYLMYYDVNNLYGWANYIVNINKCKLFMIVMSS